MAEDMLIILREVQDPRDFTARHDLGEMLFLAVCGLLCGEKTSVDIADFAAGHESEFREVLTLRHGTPSHDLERRTARVVAAPAEAKALLPGLAAFGRTESLRRSANGREEVHTRLFALSRRLAPSRFAMLVRAHWGIENHLHWTLDVVFHEDDARSRKNDAPENFALLRRLVRNILEAHPSDLPIRKKMKHASWSKDYLFNIFTHVR